MAAPVRATVRQVRPILSLNKDEARRKVINLYKAWYRQIPYIMMDYDLPITADVVRAKLRADFRKNKHVEDIRVIDMLVIKGQMELQETVQLWKNKGALMFLFADTVEKKPTDFMSKFLNGQD